MSFSSLPKVHSPADEKDRLLSNEYAAAHQCCTQISVEQHPGETFDEIFARLARAVDESEATIAHALMFGSVKAAVAGMEAMRKIFGGVDWPVTWIEGAPCDGNSIAGIQAFVVAKGELDRIEISGRVVGSVFESGDARHCMIGGLGPKQLSLSRANQTTETLEILQAALAKAGLSLADTIRTWFFLNEILAWYDRSEE